MEIIHVTCFTTEALGFRLHALDCIAASNKSRLEMMQVLLAFDRIIASSVTCCKHPALYKHIRQISQAWRLLPLRVA